MCTLSSRQTKNKRICKMKRFFHLPLLRSRGRFSSHSGGEVILARRHTVQTLLVSASIVKAYEFFNSGNEFFSTRKSFKIVHCLFSVNVNTHLPVSENSVAFLVEFLYVLCNLHVQKLAFALLFLLPLVVGRSI